MSVLAFVECFMVEVVKVVKVVKVVEIKTCNTAQYVDPLLYLLSKLPAGQTEVPKIIIRLLNLK